MLTHAELLLLANAADTYRNTESGAWAMPSCPLHTGARWFLSSVLLLTKKALREYG